MTTKTRRALFFLALMLLAGTLAIVLFQPFDWSAFAGDDILLYAWQRDGIYASSLKQALFGVIFDKYRPFPAVLSYATYRACTAELSCYLAINTFFYAALAAGIGAFAYAMLRSVYVSVLCVAILALSRFGFYHHMSTLGLMEVTVGILGVLSVAPLVLALQRGCEVFSRRALILSNLSFVVVVTTHERTIGLCPAVALLTWLVATQPAPGASARRMTPRLSWALSCLPFFAAAAYVLGKEFVLGSKFLVGTGGRDIQLEAGTFFEHIRISIANVLAWQAGPRYLSAFDIDGEGALGWFVACAGLASASLFVGIGVLRLALEPTAERAWRNWITLFALAMALGSQIATASVTIRVEMRWLLLPQCLFLLFMLTLLKQLWESRHETGVRLMLALFAVYGSAQAANSALFRRRIPEYYLWYTMESAENLKKSLATLPPGSGDKLHMRVNPRARASDQGWVTGKALLPRMATEKTQPNALTSYGDAPQILLDARDYRVVEFSFSPPGNHDEGDQWVSTEVTKFDNLPDLFTARKLPLLDASSTRVPVPAAFASEGISMSRKAHASARIPALGGAPLPALGATILALKIRTPGLGRVRAIIEDKAGNQLCDAALSNEVHQLHLLYLPRAPKEAELILRMGAKADDANVQLSRIYQVPSGFSPAAFSDWTNIWLCP